MNSFDLPRRISLPLQTTDAIRKAIQDGAWEEYLPGERRLCEIFKISRPTLRLALHKLAEEGWLDIRRGRRNRLLTERPKPKSARKNLIVLVAHAPVAQMAQVSSRGINELRTHLAEKGFVSEIVICPPESPHLHRRKLETYLRQNRILCCVLMSVSKDLQEWFAAKSVPALVLGSCHADVKLPSLDLDNRSICRHAAGVFLAQGHRRIALIVPNSGLAGDLASEEGFLEGVEVSAHQTNARGLIVRHSGTARNITAKLDALFAVNPAPTGLLVAKTGPVFTVIWYLMRRGLGRSDNVALIARDQDLLFEFIHPPIAHYRVEGDAFDRRLARLMLKLVSEGRLAPKPNLIFPKFFGSGLVRRRTDADV